MKHFLVIITMAISTVLIAQSAPTNNWTWLIGTWKGEGDGQPGKGSGTFTFAYDLDNKVITRKSHSDYPATDDKPAVIHNDLMVVYGSANGNPTKAIYFDNEAHTINYTVTYADKKIILLSDKIKGQPVFRLTYTMLDAETANTKFEMSADGEKFTTYVEGKSKKVVKQTFDLFQPAPLGK